MWRLLCEICNFTIPTTFAEYGEIELMIKGKLLLLSRHTVAPEMYRTKLNPKGTAYGDNLLPLQIADLNLW
jgi:hypothetical protein